MVGGLVANETKAGLKFTVDKVGIKSVYKDLRQNGYELISVSRSQGQGLRVLLNPNTGEKLLMRGSNSGGYKGYDPITTLTKDMNMAAYFQ